ncbi:3-ketoacyl-ACP reductase [Ensifer sp. NM-2]|uniref:SDR family NAD(P)-dependent oxidoreductase n=1 Tax=Ensifer sp. NM-2 TaxID=2109730 RepID=UPI000D13495C|nr:3-oxoacyl-ACP reductase FabG [Ensifer sp. NM-2]PSS60009.1 3-ketoacyl-ACP reductase [Ensifer sp. NM-2]
MTAQPGKVAVVTGGTSGIGLATARRLLLDGYHVAVFGQRSDQARMAEQTLRSVASKDRILSSAADLVDPSSISAFFASVEAHWRSPDTLVCCAGISPKGVDGPTPFSELTLEEWNRVLAVNLTGAMLCCQSVAPTMVDRGFGRIILVGSLAARTRPKIAGISYVCSKAGLSGLMKSMIGAVSPNGITVNLVAPGRIITDMTGPPELPVNEEARQRIPLGRLGTPDDVANVIAFLASPQAGFVNGATIDVNGGEVVAN